jgi:hypothetical protein
MGEPLQNLEHELRAEVPPAVAGLPDREAEVAKLARLLGVSEHELEFLAEAPPGELRELRERTTDRLFDSSPKLLDRVAAGASVIPAPVLARIAQRAFGPLLCARVAAAVDSAKAVEAALRQATPLGLWAEALDLLDHLSQERRRSLSALAADVLAAIERAAERHGMQDVLSRAGGGHAG